jgi:hypothetical protein
MEEIGSRATVFLLDGVNGQQRAAITWLLEQCATAQTREDMLMDPALTLLLVAKWRDWAGGGSYGPRLLADLTPLLCLYVYPPIERSQAAPLLKWALIGLASLSMGFHALGVFSPTHRMVQPWPGQTTLPYLMAGR